MADLDIRDEKAVRRRCSEILHGFFDHVNSRQLDPNFSFWRENIAANFKYSGLHANLEHESMDLPSHLHHFERLYLTEAPKFKLVVADLSTERQGGDLWTYMSYEMWNAPEGLVRQRAAQIKWSLVDSKLKILEVQTMAGPEL